MISTSAAWFAFLLFAGAMTYAGIRDVATMTISNRLVVFLVIAFAILAPAAGLNLATVMSSVVVASAVLACTFVLFAAGWIGGGDAKLLPVAVLWLGADLALPFILYTSVIGAALTVGLLQLRRVPLPLALKKTPGRSVFSTARRAFPMAQLWRRLPFCCFRKATGAPSSFKPSRGDPPRKTRFDP